MSPKQNPEGKERQAYGPCPFCGTYIKRLHSHLPCEASP